jgi:dethiobiotin synthetase
LPEERFLPEAYRLAEPMSPHASAEIDGVEIDLARILGTSLPADRPLVIEGAGGLMVPISDRQLMIDLIRELRVPALIVARTGLGTLNHTLLSIAEMRRRGIPILGVVLNGDPHESNRRAIERHGGVRVLGRVPPLDPIDRHSLWSAFRALDPTGLERPGPPR